MAVTDEENRAFEENERVAAGLTELSDDDDLDQEVQLNLNANATQARPNIPQQSVEVHPPVQGGHDAAITTGLAKMRAQQPCDDRMEEREVEVNQRGPPQVDADADREEVEFMKRFAKFMEKEGYIQKTGGEGTSKGGVQVNVHVNAPQISKKQSVQRRLDMSDVQNKGGIIDDNLSEVTIYKRAVEMLQDELTLPVTLSDE